jgi:hypothetical protein
MYKAWYNKDRQESSLPIPAEGGKAFGETAGSVMYLVFPLYRLFAGGS